jgi:hypothetical protein
MLFNKYLMGRSGEEGRIGDLARMAAADPTWPARPGGSSGWDRLARYLHRRGADREALTGLAEAWIDFWIFREEARRGH